MIPRGGQRWLHLGWNLTIAGLTAAILLTAALSKPPRGQCEGIGWGCSLYGGDAAVFEAIFLVPVALALILIGNAIIAVTGRLVRRRRRRTAP